MISEYVVNAVWDLDPEDQVTYLHVAAQARESQWPDDAIDALIARCDESLKPGSIRRRSQSLTDVGSLFPEKKWAAVCLALEQHHPLGRFGSTEGLDLDLDAPPEAPAWLVPDYVVRGHAHMLSGPEHAYKSGLRTDMMVASLTGEKFLGRSVPHLRWLVIGGENHHQDVKATLRASGLRNEHLEHLHLTTREKGVRLGERASDDWLRRVCEQFEPDVIVLDTVIRVCSGIDSMSQDQVAALYGDVLVPLVDDHDAALVMTAHHRKSGGRAGTNEALNGSVQWAAQADRTMTVAATSPLTMAPREDGNFDSHRSFAVQQPKQRAISVRGSGAEHFGVLGFSARTRPCSKDGPLRRVKRLSRSRTEFWPRLQVDPWAPERLPMRSTRTAPESGSTTPGKRSWTAERSSRATTDSTRSPMRRRGSPATSESG